MTGFSGKLILVFFTALGMVLGGAMIGAMSALFTDERPLKTMVNLAQEVKIWSMVAAVGGTFTSIEIFEMSLFKGEVSTVVKQFLLILASFAGAHIGYLLISALAEGNR